jgi:uncharacterized protein YjiS (DUF1127 family)
MIMSTILGTSTVPHETAAYARLNGLAAILKRWWATYLAWRIEQATITQLWSMSDRELKDIGLVRSDIVAAVRAKDWARERLFIRN